MTREEQLAKLLADGWEEADLRWIPVGSAVDMKLLFLKGQDATQELNKALDRTQAGQWVIKSSAVERRIRTMPGCEKNSTFDQKTP